jgi:hypothetical protein
MKLETGEPIMDGRYVVYVPGVLGWLEPYIVLWHKGGWRHRNSTEEYADKVHYWTGPLPVLQNRLPGWELADDIDEQILDAVAAQFTEERGVIDALGEYVPPQEFDL